MATTSSNSVWPFYTTNIICSGAVRRLSLVQCKGTVNSVPDMEILGNLTRNLFEVDPVLVDLISKVTKS